MIDQPTDKPSDDESIEHLRPILMEMGLISEDDLRLITKTGNITRQDWRKRRTHFPYVRLGNRYYYPIKLARDYIEQRIEKKYPQTEDAIL